MRLMKSKQQGFVITTTMVVVFTVLFIGLLVGLSSVRNAWFKKTVFENSIEVYVVDQNSLVLGKAVDFDEHEAPLIPFVDYDVTGSSGNPGNYRVLVGVRDDRFSSREKIYYTSSNCTVTGGETACMFAPSTETSGNTSINSQDVDGKVGTGGVSYQVATQGDINYAIGSASGGLPGRLYRQSETVCDQLTSQNISSYWMSQAVVSEGGTDSGGGTNPPCYEVTFYVEELSTAIRCQPGAAITTDRCVGPGEVTSPEPYCRVTGLDCSISTDANWGGAVFAACPENAGGNWQLQPAGNNSGWCCPNATNGGGAGQCQQISNNLPADGTFYQAVSVGGATNVLDSLIPPFLVNHPIDPDDFSTTAPVGE